jgi:hypothetical protein
VPLSLVLACSGDCCSRYIAREDLEPDVCSSSRNSSDTAEKGYFRGRKQVRIAKGSVSCIA